MKCFVKFTEKNLCRSLFCNNVAGWKPKSVKSSHWRCSIKEGVLKNLSDFTGKNLCWSLFNKITVLGACNFINENSDTGAFLKNLQIF